MAVVSAVISGVVEAGVSGLYIDLKALIKRKLGEHNPVSNAIEEVEADKESEGQKMVLAEKVKKAGLDQDTEVVAAAQKLIEQIKAQPGGANVVQTVIGNYNAVASDHSTASVNVNVPPKESQPQ